jgi:hypothetical protein
MSSDEYTRWREPPDKFESESGGEMKEGGYSSSE